MGCGNRCLYVNRLLCTVPGTFQSTEALQFKNPGDVATADDDEIRSLAVVRLLVQAIISLDYYN